VSSSDLNHHLQLLPTFLLSPLSPSLNFFLLILNFFASLSFTHNHTSSFSLSISLSVSHTHYLSSLILSHTLSLSLSLYRTNTHSHAHSLTKSVFLSFSKPWWEFTKLLTQICKIFLNFGP